MDISSQELPHAILTRLKARKVLPGKDSKITRLSGDGSDRSFFRINFGNSSLMAVFPSSASAPDKALAEASSSFNIGIHLYNKGVPVPQVIDFDETDGLLVFEDLGDTLLQDLAVKHTDKEKLRQFYSETITQLIHMQFAGREEFNTDWCHDTPKYDSKLMITRESGYFLNSFCIGYLGLRDFSPELTSEFKKLAGNASSQPSDYFLHRDFQSRNVMIKDDRVRFIDFQGGRLGPLGYDLASLLLDPYAELDNLIREELFDQYLNLLESYGVNKEAFLQGYYPLSLQRSLQIIGAFAFLSQVKKNIYFRTYIKPAVISLNALLAKPSGEDYPCLRKLSVKCLSLI